MSLSSDIREGSKNTKPTQGCLFTESSNGYFCCAQGAALFNAIGPEKINHVLNEPSQGTLEPESKLYELLQERYPELLDFFKIEELPETVQDLFSSPILSYSKLPLQVIIWKLNDSYGYTREQVADFVEELGY